MLISSLKNHNRIYIRLILLVIAGVCVWTNVVYPDPNTKDIEAKYIYRLERRNKHLRPPLGIVENRVKKIVETSSNIGRVEGPINDNSLEKIGIDILNRIIAEAKEGDFTEIARSADYVVIRLGGSGYVLKCPLNDFERREEDFKFAKEKFGNRVSGEELKDIAIPRSKIKFKGTSPFNVTIDQEKDEMHFSSLILSKEFKDIREVLDDLCEIAKKGDGVTKTEIEHKIKSIIDDLFSLFKEAAQKGLLIKFKPTSYGVDKDGKVYLYDYGDISDGKGKRIEIGDVKEFAANLPVAFPAYGILNDKSAIAIENLEKELGNIYGEQIQHASRAHVEEPYEDKYSHKGNMIMEMDDGGNYVFAYYKGDATYLGNTYQVLVFGIDAEMHKPFLRDYLKKDASLDTRTLELRTTFRVAPDSFYTIFGEEIERVRLLELLNEETNSGFFQLVKDGNELKVCFMGGGISREAIFQKRLSNKFGIEISGFKEAMKSNFAKDNGWTIEDVENVLGLIEETRQKVMKMLRIGGVQEEIIQSVLKIDTIEFVSDVKGVNMRYYKNRLEINLGAKDFPVEKFIELGKEYMFLHEIVHPLVVSDSDTFYKQLVDKTIDLEHPFIDNIFLNPKQLGDRELSHIVVYFFAELVADKICFQLNPKGFKNYIEKFEPSLIDKSKLEEYSKGNFVLDVLFEVYYFKMKSRDNEKIRILQDNIQNYISYNTENILFSEILSPRVYYEMMRIDFSHSFDSVTLKPKLLAAWKAMDISNSSDSEEIQYYRTGRNDL